MKTSKKLDDKRYGPYPITKVISTNAYELKLPQHMQIHPVFNVAKLLPFHKDTNLHPVDKTRPSPEVSPDLEEHDVEELIDIKPQGSGFRRPAE